MNTINHRPVSASRGRLLTALCVLFLLFDTISHIAKPGPVVEAFTRLGFPVALAGSVGIIVLWAGGVLRDRGILSCSPIRKRSGANP